jgi:hypothetical protein
VQEVGRPAVGLAAHKPPGSAAIRDVERYLCDGKARVEPF